ncbi:MAG: hypothetical protein AAGJ87_16190 [Pseudomonadota bacterium]
MTMRVLIAALCGFVLIAGAAGCSSTDVASAPSESGVAAYRAKDYEKAWALLTPLAERGHFRAQRYLAFMLIDGAAPIDCDDRKRAQSCGEEAVALLADAAGRGDNNALIVLETMRAAGASYAPADDAIIAIELKRARRGDPMTAWRLAKRYRDGDGVAASAAAAVKWLAVAAKGKPSLYPYADDASFLLCEAYASGAGVRRNARTARRWCERAAAQGHSGAVIALNSLH